MKERDKLDMNDPKFNPFYRSKWYNFDNRCKIKYTNKMLWYSNSKVGDPFKQDWKRRMKRKGDDKTGNHRVGEIKQKPTNVTTVMFVPSTPGGKLITRLELLEDELTSKGEFGVKLIEKSGVPLSNLFIKKTPVISGCPLNSNTSEERLCKVCENDSLKCFPKNTVYEAECIDCSANGNHDMMNLKFKYVGESSRALRMRVKEHWENLDNLSHKSFMVAHWMDKHSTQMTPPNFEFRIIGKYNDCLSRQLAEALFIEDRGNLNKKSEFSSNHICRLESNLPEWEKEKLREVEAYERANFVSNVISFTNVIRNVRSYLSSTNPRNSYRKRQSPLESVKEAVSSKVRKMDTSTPQWKARESKEAAFDEVSPIQLTPGGLKQVGCLAQDETDEIPAPPETSEVVDVESKETGLSPQVRKLLIKPKTESEFIEMRKLVIETINLTRAAMRRGLIEDDGLTMDELLEDNSMYKPVGDRFSISRMLMGLNLDDWERDDIYSNFGINRSDADRSRALLVVDDLHDGSWEECNFDKTSPRDKLPQIMDTEGILLSPLMEDKLPQILDAEGILLLPPRRSGNEKVQAVRTSALEDEGSRVVADESILLSPPQRTGSEGIQASKAVGTSDLNDMCKTPSTPVTVDRKRKEPSLSPYGETQVARALKLGKGNDHKPFQKTSNGYSDNKLKPLLKTMNNSLKTPTTSQKRQYRKIKRCLNPDKKQLLITSSFSPKPRPSGDADTVDSTSLINSDNTPKHVERKGKESSGDVESARVFQDGNAL